MHEIFINYRRIDAEQGAGRLCGDLRRSFGDDAVFMDSHPGRIPWGAEWRRELASALQRCDVLIALIGPQWSTCTRSDGRRRLQVEDDWVRREIATALQRGILVMPVLLDGAKPPRDEDLPEELRSGALDFAGRQCNASPMTVRTWDADVAALIAELLKRAVLKTLRDMVTAQHGIGRLKELLATDPAVRDALHDSRSRIASTDHEVGQLKLLKDIHDALHRIESDCLVPLELPQAPPYQVPLALRAFQRERALIEQLLRSGPDAGDLPELLTADLARDLGDIEASFKRAAESRDAADSAEVVRGLRGLSGVTAVQLDTLIDSAAKRLKLDALLGLMATVRGALPDAAAPLDRELKPLLDSTEALVRLRAELDGRVIEHGRLQSLDRKLRRVCGGDWRPGPALADEPRALGADWKEVCGARANLQPPYSDRLEPSIGAFSLLEGNIDDAVRAGDRQAARGLLNAYFHEVRVAFKNVDEGLKGFCDKLGQATAPLKTILDMLPVGA